MAETTPLETVPATQSSFRDEFADFWRKMPHKAVFGVLFASWFGLFWFLGNPTLGYVDSPAVLGWLEWIYSRSEDDSHGRLIPFVVLYLFWWKRHELIAAAGKPWWPGLALLILALAVHVLGYTIQQPQVCLVAFFAALYAVMGIAWGWRFLKTAFFPFFLFAFSVPTANVLVPVAFPLRMAATKITAGLCKGVLGIDVIQDGTRITDALGQYQYEVAAACSGIRSLTAISAIALIYAFVAFKKPWQRAVMIASAVPLAIVSNVFRLSSIIIAAEGFGQKAGNWVHSNSFAGLFPYIPAIGGMILIAHLLSRPRRSEVLNARAIPSPAASL
jgi:exosortase